MSRNDFYWSAEPEPHKLRRKQILQEFPEIRGLFGVDASLKYKAVLLTLIHLATPLFLTKIWYWDLLVLLVLGATLSHVLFLAVHEITHDLAFRKRAWNNWLAIFVNLPLVFPFSMAFRVYHAKHHWHQGDDAQDTDIPSRWETRTFKGRMGKLAWMVNQILFYAIRPLMVYPIKPDKWQVINALVQFSCMGLYLFFVGWYGVGYLILSLFLAGGLHPIAGHFIAEHYVFKEGQETYSYYGPLNKITFNVGYHNEHHDFPTIPGYKLPEVRRIAAKYYDDLHSYNSWTRVLWDFVRDESVSLFSRIKRTNVS